VAVSGSITSGVAGRYAAALFDLAESGKALDAVGDELKALGALLNESEDLAAMVKSPLVSADDQMAAMSAILKQAGASALTTNFVGLVAKNRRLFALGDMVKAYGALLAAHKGEVEADVTTAAALDDKQMARLKDTIKDVIGKDVAVNTRVDQSLLGGMIVKIGSRMIDTSLKTKLQSLKIAMKEVG